MRSAARIVSLAPSATSILCALGAKKQLIGVTRWCRDVAPVDALPTFGDCWRCDADAVAALQPDLVIGSVPYRAEVVEALLRRGLTFALAACDALLTGAPDAGDLFDSPFPDLTPAELAAFVEGDRAFGQAFAPRDGLGPIFNNVSCASCHSGDGRGVLSNALTRFSLGTDPALDLGGPQLQDRAIPGAEPEVLPNGVDVTLRLPPPVFGALVRRS